MKVRANTVYQFNPVPWDTLDPPIGNPQPGALLIVVNLPGCPRANTMNHCHVNFAETGEFAGLISCNSLESIN